MGTSSGQSWKMFCSEGCARDIPGWICSVGSEELLLRGGMLGLAPCPARSLWKGGNECRGTRRCPAPRRRAPAFPGRCRMLLGWATTSWMNVQGSLNFNLSCFLVILGFFCSINPLFKLGLPSWVYQSLAFSSVFLRLGDIPSRKVFPATAELCSLPHLGSESLGFGKAAGLTGKIHQGEAAGITGEPRWSHLAQHIQGICKGCSSRPWKRHKDLNLLFWQVQGAPQFLFSME